MLSILNREPAPADLEAVNQEAVNLEAVQPSPKAEFEIVLGRLQVASVLFVFTVVLVIFSAGAYLAGRASTPAQVAAAAPSPQPVVQATIVPPPAPQPEPAKRVRTTVFGDPVKGAVYIQMGAVDEGIAALLVEGLRARGFEAFAAPGPNEKIYRVLIGPLPTAEAYNFARDAVNQIGLVTFMRRYEP